MMLIQTCNYSPCQFHKHAFEEDTLFQEKSALQNTRMAAMRRVEETDLQNDWHGQS